MSATLGAALKKIAVALLADRKNWEKLAVALFAVLLHTLQLLVKRVAAPFHRFQPPFNLVHPGVLVFVWLFQRGMPP